MGFGDQIKQFTDNAKEKIAAAERLVEGNAKKRLADLFGDDVNQIKSIRLDADVGKFHSVDAPAFIVDRLRKEGLLKE